MLTADMLSSFPHQRHRQTRFKVYNAGGTQIGFATLGERSERLTFPAHWKIEDAPR